MDNDYNIAGEDGSNAKSDAVYAWLQQMLDQGVPIDGVGDQGHRDTQFGFPTQMQQNFERNASLGLKVAITEADVRTFVTNATQQVPTDHLAHAGSPLSCRQASVTNRANMAARRPPALRAASSQSDSS